MTGYGNTRRSRIGLSAIGVLLAALLACASTSETQTLVEKPAEEAGVEPCNGPLLSIVDAGTVKQAELVITPPTIAMEFAANASDLFWADGVGNIFQASKSGGEAKLLVKQGDVQATYTSGLVADSKNLYWAWVWGGVVGRVPLAGGNQETLATGLAWVELALHPSGDLYGIWSTKNEVFKFAQGAPPRQLIANDPNRLSGIALDDSSVYWISSPADGALSSVVKVPNTGGTPSPVVTNQRSASSLSVAGDSLYWVTAEGQKLALWKAHREGGSAVALACPGGDLKLTSFAADVDGLYLGYGGKENLLLRMPLAGGSAEVLAAAPEEIRGVLVQTEAIYWVGAVSTSAGVIRRVAR